MTRLGPLLFALMVPAMSVGCGSSGVTNTTGPTATRCQLTVTNSSSSFAVSGGDGTVSVTVARECQWSAATQASWISITSAKEGQGDGSVTYHVAANPDPVTRSGAITVGDQRADVSQAAAPCRFDVSAPAEPFAATGGDTSLTVQTHSVCSWTAASGASWITVNPASGSGNGSVRLSATSNTGAQRTATVTVAGARMTVTQLGAAPAPTPTPTPPPAPAPPPTPTPPPPPAPPPQQIDLSGLANNVHGTCPALTFTLGTHAVRTSSATAFSGGGCKDLRSGTNVAVHGTLQADGSVDASTVRFGTTNTGDHL